MRPKVRAKSKPRSKVISVKEMYRRYPSEWVLIGNPISDEHLNPLRGEVLAHSKDRDEMYQKMLELRPGHVATLYTGKPAPNMEFVL